MPKINARRRPVTARHNAAARQEEAGLASPLDLRRLMPGDMPLARCKQIA